MFFNLTTELFTTSFFSKSFYLVFWSIIWILTLRFEEFFTEEDSAIFVLIDSVCYVIDLPMLVALIQIALMVNNSNSSIPDSFLSQEVTPTPIFNSEYEEFDTEMVTWQYMKDFPQKQIPQERYFASFWFGGDFETFLIFYFRIVPLMFSYFYFFGSNPHTLIFEEYLVLLVIFLFTTRYIHKYLLIFDDSSLDIEEFTHPTSQLHLHHKLLKSKSFISKKKNST